MVAVVAVVPLGSGQGRADSLGLVMVTDPAGRPVILNAPGGVGRVAPARVPSASRERRENLWPMVREIASSHGLDPNLVDLVIRMESGYNPWAVSRKGAQGMMQLMPATASMYGVRDVFDARQNVVGGVRYLRDLLARYSSNLSLALAAYNAGPTAVERHGGIPPFRETQHYVSSILDAYQGGGAGKLGGGFGTMVHRGPPPSASQGPDGRLIISNLPQHTTPQVTRRLRL